MKHHDEPVLMPCGHPRAARMIESTKTGLRTVCWACKIERETR